LSSDGTSLKTDPGLAVDYGTVPDPSVDDTTSTYSGNQTASVAGVTSMSAATWFWIILLILILVGAIIYIYNRNKRNV
jgi:hypothetical protein